MPKKAQHKNLYTNYLAKGAFGYKTLKAAYQALRICPFMPNTKQKHYPRSIRLRLEFFTTADRMNGPVVTWRLRLREDGPVVIRSAERWLTLAEARSSTGLLLRDLFEDSFEVCDLTRSAVTKTQAAKHKSPARSSKAGA